jgi:hypothetical protein
MRNGFDEKGFLEYLEREFPTVFTNSFARELVENVIDYGIKYERVSKDQICYFLQDMLPEISFGEIAMFVEDGSLTEFGKREKKKRWRRKVDKTRFLCRIKKAPDENTCIYIEDTPQPLELDN